MQSSQKSAGGSYRLRCRHCGQGFIPPLVCPTCRGFRLFPRGAASERVEEEIIHHVSGAWVGRLDADVTGKRSQQMSILREFQSQKGPAVLIATAMALSHRLPRLDAVLVPAFDQLLAIPNFRAEEETLGALFRLRSRLKPGGLFLLQSWHPDNRIIQILSKNTIGAYLKQELAMRKQFSWPPYCRLAKLTLRSTVAEKGIDEATRLLVRLEGALPKMLQRELIGPFPAFIPRVRGKYIHHLLIKWKPKNIPDVALERALAQHVPSSWDIDVNPLSIL